MDHTRIDRNLTEPNDRTPALERIWAATRPADLRADEFDRIWAEVQRAYDARPLVLAMPRPARSRRTIALVAMGLAQAAAVLVAVWVLNRPSAVDRPVVRVDPPQAKAPVVVARQEVEADETLILHLEGGRVTELRRPAPGAAASDSLALLDLPQHTPSDLLSLMESYSR
jgi:hypothetical protein